MVDPSAGLDSYEAFAAAYDGFTHGYLNEQWTGRLLEKGQGCGLEGNRLLDVGCGTGKSFIPMLERGWDVVACDISPAMVEIARHKVGAKAEVSVADMRRLPTFGDFDLVWALDDAVNYLLSAEELEDAIEGMAKNLGPTGVLLFDVSTLLVYKTFFSSDTVVAEKDRQIIWRGQMDADEVGPGSVSSAVVESDDGSITPHIHRQRHFTQEEMLGAIERAGLVCREVIGEREGVLYPLVDESIHTKAVYICAHR